MMTVPREQLTTGLGLFSDRLLRTIIDTECQKANMAAHDTILQANKHMLTGWFWTTEDDDRVCILCLGLSENYYTLEEGHPPLPLHDLCRCWPRPDGPTWRDLGVDVDEWGDVERPIHYEDEGVRFATGGIKGGFRDLPESVQIEMIGKGRVELLKSGKISLSDLVDKTTGELVLLQDLKAGRLPGVTYGDLAKRLESIQDKDVRYSEIEKFITRNASSKEFDILAEIPESYATIRQNELMRKVDISGYTLYYPEGIKGEAAKQVDEILRLNAPDALKRHTNKILMTTQSNKQDDYWRSVNPNYGSSLATAGVGNRVTVYGGKALQREEMWHEMGHNFAEGKWGSARNIGPEFAKATSAEGFVSKYAEDMSNVPGSQLTENFAESVRLYFQTPRHFKSKWPKTFGVIDRLMKEPGFGG